LVEETKASLGIEEYMQFVAFTTIVILIITAYWALSVFPKQRDYKKHIKYLQTLEVGDEVITFGGLIGTITELDVEDGVGRLRLADNLEVRILTAALQKRYDPEELRSSIRMAQGIVEPNEAEMTENET